MYPIIANKTKKTYDNAKKLEKYQKDNIFLSLFFKT